MNSEFWCITVQPGFTYKRQIKYCIDIKNAVLNLKDVKPGDKTDGIVQLRCAVNNEDMPIANFSVKHGILQVPTNLIFGPDTLLEFSIVGAQIPVTLNGECGGEPEEDSDDELDMNSSQEELDEDESVDEEELAELGELLNSKGKRKLSVVPNGMPKKKAKLHAVLASEETLSECSSDEEDYNPCDDSQLTDNDNLPEDETLNDSDLEDESDEDEEEDEYEDVDSDDDDDQMEVKFSSAEFSEDSEEETVESPPKPVSNKKLKQVANGTPKVDSPKAKKSNGEAEASPTVGTPKLSKKQRKELAKAQPDSAKKSNGTLAVPSQDVSTTATPKDKKKKNKDKEAKSPVAAEVKTPKIKKEDRKSASPTDKKVEASKSTKTPSKLRGGVQILDISEGTGAPVAKGAKVSMYYRGTLKKNGKCFDYLTKGAPFTFKLGFGNVIDGWDIGVQGMKVGGKRKISCPAAMAYGKEGSPPVIPPNADLDFEVTLLSFK